MTPLFNRTQWRRHQKQQQCHNLITVSCTNAISNEDRVLCDLIMLPWPLNIKWFYSAILIYSRAALGNMNLSTCTVHCLIRMSLCVIFKMYHLRLRQLWELYLHVISGDQEKICAIVILRSHCSDCYYNYSFTAKKDAI